MNRTALNPALTTYQVPYRAPLLASLMLIMNQTDSSALPLTDSLGNRLFAANTPENSMHDHEHGGDAIKRNLRDDNVEQAEDERE